MKLHFIAIGGSAMHNLAIALKQKGYFITGSDDEIFDPAKSRLEKYGLLPKSIDWSEENINSDLDAIVLGMHAKKDNPELLKAQALGLKIYSYPEFLYEMSKEKIRIVIGGSHGKTSITAMILHALNHCGVEADFMVGAQLSGFEVMVKLTDNAKYMVLEGDEYLTSPIDLRPKFHLYNPNIALISGIAWDHINVFPTFDIYKEQFSIFCEKIEKEGSLIYCNEDKNVREIANSARKEIKKLPYGIISNRIEKGKTIIEWEGKEYILKVFGEHNLMNIYGAMLACQEIGISNNDFLNAIQSFSGASKRLELVKENDNVAIYKDFAHSPSKLKATISALKNQFPDRELVAAMELHTFSSLTSEFLLQYKGAMDMADLPIVYFNPKTIEHKGLKEITKEQVFSAFDREDIIICNKSSEVIDYIRTIKWENTNLLMMTSGNFDGINFDELANKLI
ncbi:MAG: Mur ligase family protein [Bacteroidales bacterium]|jgi:UDP-N-acetylmuramate: L-alanyl-gamma-D-glutamyl-meso-diaminopimelate ligase|nr:Mur ligase family protein [Bacteroidales bacterium]